MLVGIVERVAVGQRRKGWRIGAQLLFPSAIIRNEDFTTLRLPSGVDLAIGNPPFSACTVRGDAATGRPRLAWHDFLCTNAIADLRGGPERRKEA